MTIEIDPRSPSPIDILLALRDQIRPERWKKIVATKANKLEILHRLQASPNTEKPITIVNALSLLQELKIVKSPHSMIMVDLIKRLIPAEASLTPIRFVRLLFSMAESNPKITDEQRAELRTTSNRLSQMPDRPMRTDEFLRLCEIMIERTPEETTS